MCSTSSTIVYLAPYELAEVNRTEPNQYDLYFTERNGMERNVLEVNWTQLNKTLLN